jgi:hypothetical protein
VDKIGVVRDHRWLGADKQAERLAPRCRIVVSLGGGKSKLIKSHVEFADLVTLSREETTIELVYAFLLAEPKRKHMSGGMRTAFRAALAAIEKRGAQVFDLEGDIGSDKRKAFLATVDTDIGRSNRGRSSSLNGEKNKNRGRQPKTFTAEQTKEARAVWRNLKDYPTWDDAEDAMPKGFTRYRAHKLWGSRK